MKITEIYFKTCALSWKVMNLEQLLNCSIDITRASLGV